MDLSTQLCPLFHVKFLYLQYIQAYTRKQSRGFSCLFLIRRISSNYLKRRRSLVGPPHSYILISHPPRTRLNI